MHRARWTELYKVASSAGIVLLYLLEEEQSVLRESLPRALSFRETITIRFFLFFFFLDLRVVGEGSNFLKTFFGFERNFSSFVRDIVRKRKNGQGTIEAEGTIEEDNVLRVYEQQEQRRHK